MDESLKDAIEAAATAARKSWPPLSADERSFIPYLVERLPRHSPDALASLHVRDLFLAWACERGDRRALEEFERHLLAPLDKFVSRFDPSPAFADDVRQELREKLFMGKKRVRDYSGRGSLAAWVRVSAVRAAMNLSRRARAQQPIEMPDLPHAPDSDPELEYLQALSMQDFRDALHAAVAELPRQDREVLWLYYFEGLDAETIAARYGVHRTTIARGMARARAAVVLETRRRIAERLGIEPTEEDFALFSREDVSTSLSRILTATEDTSD